MGIALNHSFTTINVGEDVNREYIYNTDEKRSAYRTHPNVQEVMFSHALCLVHGGDFFQIAMHEWCRAYQIIWR